MATENIVEFEAGAIVIQEKSPCDGLFIIKEGQLEVSKVGADGKKITIGIVRSGEYLGESALFLNRPHTSTVTALSKVRAIKLSKAAIDSQLKVAPAWLVALVRGLVMRLQQVNELLRKSGLEADASRPNDEQAKKHA